MNSISILIEYKKKKYILIGRILLIIDPNVPPTEKAAIPKKIKTNNRNRIITITIISNNNYFSNMPFFSKVRKIIFASIYSNA